MTVALYLSRENGQRQCVGTRLTNGRRFDSATVSNPNMKRMQGLLTKRQRHKVGPLRWGRDIRDEKGWLWGLAFFIYTSEVKMDEDQQTDKYGYCQICAE
jgi:hypothetical protein